MDQLLTLSYYFAPYPNPNFQFSKITLAICALILVAGIALIFFRKKMGSSKQQKWIRLYGKRLVNMGILGLALLFFREVGIPYFSMRIWWVVWLILLIAFSVLAVKHAIKAKNQVTVVKPKAEDPRTKYLPKRKKRK